MKLTLDTGTIGRPEKGILYVLEIELETEKVIKVGVTCRERVEDRVCEILTAMWKRYRFFPKCYVKRFSTVDDPYGKEESLLESLADYSYTPSFTFTGSTEFFQVDLHIVTDLYDELKS